MSRTPARATQADERRWGLDETDRMVRMWGDGWPIIKIAVQFGISEGACRKRVKQRLARMEWELMFPKVAKWMDRTDADAFS